MTDWFPGSGRTAWPTRSPAGSILLSSNRGALKWVEAELAAAYCHDPCRRGPTMGVDRGDGANPASLMPPPRVVFGLIGAAQPDRRGAGCQQHERRYLGGPRRKKFQAARKKHLTRHPNLLYKFGYDGTKTQCEPVAATFAFLGRHGRSLVRDASPNSVEGERQAACT